METRYTYFFIAILFAQHIFCMRHDFSPLLMREALAWCPEATLSKKLTKIKNGTDSVRCDFLNGCINLVTSECNNKPDVLLPVYMLMELYNLKSGYVPALSRDAFLFNRILFQHPNPNFDITSVIFMLEKNMYKMTKEHKSNVVRCGREYWPYRVNGKTFTICTSEAQSGCCTKTDEGKAEYWETVLNPAIFPENFQCNSDKTWSVSALNEKIKILLLCLKKKNIVVPKFLLIKNIIVSAFSQPLDAIESMLCAAGKLFKEEMLRYKEFVSMKALYCEPDYVQAKFFDNFDVWYEKKIRELLNNQLAIITSLINCSLREKQLTMVRSLKREKGGICRLQ